MCSTEFTTQEKIYALLRMLEKHYTFVEVRQLLQQLIHKIEDDKINIKDIKQTTKSSVDGGENILTFTLSNGAKYEYVVKNGTKGSQGLLGEPGKDGTLHFEELTPELKEMLKGDKGDKGDQGDQGPEGPRGPEGPKGKDGINGQNGNDGASGKNATIKRQSFDSEGNTIITWNDNTVTTILRGPKGSDSVITFEDLTDEQKESLKGEPGNDYVLTDGDKTEIAEMIEVPTYEAGAGIDITNNVVSSTLDGKVFVVVDQLPVVPEDKNLHKIHLIPKEQQQNGNSFDEYLYVNNKWEFIGNLSSNVSSVDVLIDGTSIVSDGVANIPLAGQSTAGLIRVLTYDDKNFGIWFNRNYWLNLHSTTEKEISDRAGTKIPIYANTIDFAVKSAMCDGKGAAWTSDEQAAAKTRMGIKDPVIAEEATFDESTMEEGTIYFLY